MNPLDSVLRRPLSSPAARVSRLLVVGATAVALVLTPTASTLAAPGSAANHRPAQVATRQDDNSSPKIVPAGGAGSVERDEPSTANADASSNEVDHADPIKLPGIVSTRVDLSPNQWTGALDGRLVEPFAVALRPERVRSDAIGLNAAITPREIINGEMQTPKDEFEVSWYRETGSPGTKGNLVLAGHLNWYTTPQAVFYNINELKRGDEIVITGEDGVDYTYKVKWVKLVETADVDMETIVGPTKKPSLTLITCGGEWESSAGQYKQRTVVRAELVTRR